MGRAVTKLDLDFNYVSDPDNEKKLANVYAMIFQKAYRNLAKEIVVTKSTKINKVVTFTVDGIKAFKTIKFDSQIVEAFTADSIITNSNII